MTTPEVPEQDDPVAGQADQVVTSDMADPGNDPASTGAHSASAQSAIADALVPGAAPESPAVAGGAPAAQDSTVVPAGESAAAVVAPATPAIAPAAETHSLRAAAARWLMHLGAFAFGVVLFVGGVALGISAFQASQRPAAVAVEDPSTSGIAAPPSVNEFVEALGSGGADAVRSSLPPEVFALLTSELQRWDFQRVQEVEVLSTTTDGEKSATAVVLVGTSAAGGPQYINLIVHAENGRIVSFR